MKELKLTTEDIDDIMCAADNGISYWCDEWEIGERKMLGEYTSEQIGRGGTIKLHIQEENSTEDEGYWEILTQEKLIQGIYICNEYNYAGCAKAIIELDDYSRIDTACVDSGLADCIVQCALFGDLIYG